MGKFDKAMGAMDDEMLEEVNGGFTPYNITGKTDDQLIDNYNYYKEDYQRKKRNGQIGTPEYNDIVDTLEHYEAEMARRGIPYDREN